MTKHSPTARPEGPLPPCLVTVPAGLEPGMTFQFMLPPPAPTATVAVAVVTAETSEAENPVAQAQ